MKLLWTLYTLFFLLCSTAVSYGNTDESPSQFSCNLPAPTGLRVTGVTRTSATVRWNPVAGAIGYKMKVYKLPANNLVADYNTAGTVTTVNNLESGKTYRFVVAAICASGQVSGNASNILKGIIVMDLVLNNSSFKSLPDELTKIYADKCFQDNWFVGNTSIGENYYMELHNNASNQSAWFHITFETDIYVIIEQITEGVPNPFESASILEGSSPNDAFLFANNMTICTLSIQQVLYSASNSGMFFKTCWTILPPNYELNFYWGDAPEFQGQSIDRSPAKTTQTDALTVKTGPNPAKDVLFVSVDNKEATTANVVLMGIDGSVHLSQTLPAQSAQQLALQVAHLPQGMYFIQVGTSQHRVMQRIIKGE